MRYSCPYLSLLSQTVGCKTILPVAYGSLMTSLCPILNITKIVPEQRTVSGELNWSSAARVVLAKMKAFPGKEGIWTGWWIKAACRV